MIIQAIHNYYAEYNLPYIEGHINSEIIATIKGTLQDIKILLLKSEELGMYDEIAKYEDSIRAETQLNTIETLKTLEQIQREFVILMAKHNFKDWIQPKKQPWDTYKVKKKLQLPELEQQWINPWNKEKLIPAEYYDYISEPGEKPWDTIIKCPKHKNKKLNVSRYDRRPDQLVFLMTFHTVVNKGDCHLLLTGVNLSGKTNTAVAMLKLANWFYRNYWKVSYTDKEKFEEVPEFRMDTNITYLPLENALDDILGDNQFRTQDLNEGMKFATKANWQNKKAQDAAAIAYVARSHHPIVIYEYQVSKRPPSYFMERFNFWLHKMNKKWMVLSMASGIYRKSDPYYMDEIDKIKDDDAISHWFVHKNANYITRMRAPRMIRKDEKEFDKLHKEAHQTLLNASKIQKALSDIYYLKLEEFWNKINVANEMAYSDIQKVLIEQYPDLNKHQITKFMKLYDDYDASQKFTKRKQVILSKESSQ
jgi:hypothetical protein